MLQKVSQTLNSKHNGMEHENKAKKMMKNVNGLKGCNGLGMIAIGNFLWFPLQINIFLCDIIYEQIVEF